MSSGSQSSPPEETAPLQHDTSYEAYRRHELTWSRYFHYGVFENTEDLERAQELALDRFASLGAISAATDVLDLGCGIASTPIYLARMYGCRIVGIDPVESQIAYGRRRVDAAGLSARIELLTGTAEAIPAASQSFDVVLINEVLCLVPDKAKALAEIYRVLRPGGRLVVSDLYDSVGGRTTAYFHQAMHHVTPMASYEGYRSAIEASGFVMAASYDLTPEVAKSYQAALARLEQHPPDSIVTREEVDVVRGFYEYCISDRVRNAIGWAHFVATRPVDTDEQPEHTPAEASEIERLLRELEALDEGAALAQLHAAPYSSRRPDDVATVRAEFSCPTTRSPWFGRQRCNLVILLHEFFERDTFDRIARHVRALDPWIDAVVLRDHPETAPTLPPNPTMTFAPAVVRHRSAAPGRTFCGYPLSKSQEHEALERAGLPVPRWVLLSESESPNLDSFDKFVVQKPDRGGRGASVKVVRKSRVRWEPTVTRASGTSEAVIIQEIIDTGPRPVSYRVNTLFGKVLYTVRYDRPTESRRLTHPTDPNAELAWGSIVASPRGSKVTLNYDADIIRIGERAACAFPDLPLLGIDIIREASSGRLFILEANSIGFVWNFGAAREAAWGLSFEEQFDGIRKAAYVLAEKTQECAS